MKNRIFKGTVSLILLLSILTSPLCAFAADEKDDFKGFYNTSTPGEMSYGLFMNILELYLEESLYKTDKAELLEAMVRNILQSDPTVLPILANALLTSNDVHSRYYLASDGFMSATTKGFGLYLEERNGGIYVNETLAHSNARFAGILPGDRFVSVEGYNVEGLSLMGLQRLLAILPLEDKNPDDSPVLSESKKEGYSPERLAELSALDWDARREVSITLERTYDTGEKGLVTFSLPRGTSDGKYVTLELHDGGATALIDIDAFAGETLYDEFLSYLEEAVAQGSKTLIIDLRDNLGGYFDTALKICDLFVEGGKPMMYTRYRDTDPESTMSTDIYYGDKFEEYIVLVNENTASASEILTSVLDGYRDAAVIGKTTFGKAVGQNAYTVTNGDTFTITTFELLTKDLTSYNGIGISPDIEIPLCEEKYEFPTGLSHFNHVNYVDIIPGAQNDATLALEQRFGILGLLKEGAIDGIYDDATACAIIIYKFLQMNDLTADATVTYDMVTSMTELINIYKDLYLYTDSQLAVALKYAENHSQGKRLAKEYITAQEKLDKLRAEQKEISDTE